MAEYEDLLANLMMPGGGSAVLPASDYTGQGQPLFWMNPTAPAVPGAPAENLVEQTQRSMQQEAQQEVAKASEASDLPFLDPQQVMGMLVDQQRAIAMNNVQKTLMGFAEGQMQSPYAGNRVFGASIAGSIGANQKDIERKLSLSTQLMAYAQDLVDFKRRQIQFKNEEALQPLKVRAAEADIKAKEAAAAVSKLEAEDYPNKIHREAEGFESRMRWEALNQKHIRLSNEAAEAKAAFEKETDPLRKSLLEDKVRLSRMAVMETALELENFPAYFKAKTDSMAAQAYQRTEAGNWNARRQSGGGGRASSGKTQVNSFVKAGS